MKKLIYLFSITVALTIFTSVNASAKTSTLPANAASVAPGVMCDLFSDIWGIIFGTGSTGTNNNNHGNTTTGSTQLPINNGVVFLTIAGIVIGVTTLKRYKVANTEIAQK